MKLITFLSILLIILLSSESVISVTISIRYHRKHKNHSGITHKRRNHTKDKCDGKKETTLNFNVVTFLITAIQRMRTSFTGEIVGLFKSTVGITAVTDSCMGLLTGIYNSIEDQYKAWDSVVTFAKFDSLGAVEELGVTGAEKTDLIKFKANPRKLCEIRMKILAQKTIDSGKLTEFTNNVVKLIEHAQVKNWGMEKLDQHSKDFFNGNTKRYLRDFVVSVMAKYKTVQSSLAFIKSNIANTNSNSKIAAEQLKTIDKPNCSKLPEVDLDECYKTGIAIKAKSVWSLLTTARKEKGGEEITKCIAKLISGAALSSLISYGIDKVISIVTNIFALFIYKFIKLFYFGIRLVLYIVEASKSKDKEIRSKAWGNAAGTVFQIVDALLVRRKKLRRFRR